MLLKRLIFVACACFAVCLFTPGCEGPTPRVAPIAKNDSSVSSEASPQSDPESEADIVEVIDIPVPSGKLLGQATACTVRLGNDDFDGSGVIVHREGNQIYVLTVAHAVLEGVNRVELFSLLSSRPQKILTDLNVISADKRADLALIRARVDADTEIVVAKLAKLSSPKYAYSVGCGGGKPPKVSPEQIIRAEELSIRLPNEAPGELAKRFMWETSEGQEQGRSGGPLLNANGDLLGIALGKNGGNGYYSHIREISEYLIDNGHGDLVTCPELLISHQGSKNR